MNTPLDPSIAPISPWLASVHPPTFPPVDADLSVDVVIVGGGITGITAAYLLKQAGLTVALLERERCLHVDTGHTTAHLTAVVDERFQTLAEEHSPETARAVWDAGGAAIDQIERIVRTEKIACGFRWVSGYLHAAEERLDDRSMLEREAAACSVLGIRCEFLDAVPHFATPGIRFPHQALFNPLAYLSPLLEKIDGDGSHVFEMSEATEFFDDPRMVGVGDHRIQFQHLVLATHNPLTGNSGMVASMLFQTKLALYTTYALGARIPAGSLPVASFWDTADPYRYLRIEPRDDGYDYAIYGGEDHKTGQVEDTEACFERLTQRFLARVPGATIDRRWSGQVIETPDGLPYIGWFAPGQFIATGYSGNGMTWGTLGAMMAVDAITGKSNPWSDLLDPNRKKLRGATLEYLKENKDYPYYLVRDRLAGAPAAEKEDIAPGEGRLAKIDGEKLAAYRDDEGNLTLCSPVCPHLGCIVAWNGAERTWDCPCHGSRFKATGEVISGPAESPLERIEPKAP